MAEQHLYQKLFDRLAANDPDITEVDFGYTYSRFIRFSRVNNVDARLLGESLTSNTVVSALVMPLAHLRNDAEALAPLLQVLRQNAHLKTVQLNIVQGMYFAGVSVAVLFINAVAQSRSICKLTVKCPPFPGYIDSLATLLRNTTSLKQLVIFDAIFGASGSATERNFLAALRAYTPLTALELRQFDLENPEPPFHLVFEALKEHAHLEDLALVSDRRYSAPSFDVTLPPQLKHLELGGFHFERQRMFQSLCSGFRSNPTMKLSFKACEFSRTTTSRFRELLHQGGNLLQQGGTGVCSLTLGPRNRFAHPIGQILAKVFESYASRTNVDRHHQQLEELTIHDSDLQRRPGQQQQLLNGWIEFFTALGDHARCIKLRVLTVHGVEATDLDAIALCLPKLVHLKKLFLRNVQGNVDGLVPAMKRNGSLEEFQVTRVDVGELQGRSQFSTANQQRVQSYCERNQVLPKILASKSETQPVAL